MSRNEKFNIPENHTVNQVKFKAKGTMAQNEYWTYEELDENGQKVSTIEYWECTSLNSLKTSSGYRKYNLENQLIEEKL